jgi:hypothetical protein
MEALWDRELVATANTRRQLPEAQGYLAQPEMRSMIGCALDLGMTLHAYEVAVNDAPQGVGDPMGMAFTNWREEQQARNLSHVLEELAGEKLVVWCGNGHHNKRPVEDWKPMGYQFIQLTNLEPFCIDQSVTVEWPEGHCNWRLDPLEAARVASAGGCAGFQVPDGWVDAYLLATDNVMD